MTIGYKTEYAINEIDTSENCDKKRYLINNNVKTISKWFNPNFFSEKKNIFSFTNRPPNKKKLF